MTRSRKLHLINLVLIPVLASFFFLFESCGEKAIPVRIQRFDQDLFSPGVLQNPMKADGLIKKYGEFYYSFVKDILQFPPETKDNFRTELDGFVSYPGIQQLKHETDSVFPDLAKEEEVLGKALGRFSKEFPGERIPTFVSFISEYTLANAVYDTIVGIGLDMYLGENYSVYTLPVLNFPDFMRRKLRKEYLIPNALRTMAVGRYESQVRDNRFISMMLYEGKLLYFVKQLLPEVNDTILLGYTAENMKWAQDNESMIWSHIIDTHLLFSADVTLGKRYLTDGPFTVANGVPRESAPAIGIFAGYKIISKYMEENKGVTLKQLMDNSNWEEILKLSRYKP